MHRWCALWIAGLMAASLAACAPAVKKIDRTEGLALEFRWISGDFTRACYYQVGCDGEFASSGGVRARDRALDFKTTLSDADIARYLTLLRALAVADRPKTKGDAGDRSELIVYEGTVRRSFQVRGMDLSIDELAAFCKDVSMRQFRDVIDAQPVTGELRK